VDSIIGKISALGKHQIPQSGGNINDLLNGTVRQMSTTCEIQYTQVLIRPIWGEVKESIVRDQITVGQSKFTQALAIANESSDGFITDVPALMEIDFKNIRAVLGEGKNGTIIELVAFIEFELGRSAQDQT
jgi:hypothetical protein